ncbi:MAG: ATP synthase F1 subunit delta [Chloroflexota bacterium]|nr:ATP synthase F1 subunit delta [Chloroflexota bacterium]
MPLGGSAARRYAEAMHDIALGESRASEFRASLNVVAAGLAGRPLRMLADPSVPVERRLAAVKAVAAGEDPAIGALLHLLVRRERVALIPAIAMAFGDIADREAGIAKAKITTAVPLDEMSRQQFLERLERSSGKRIEATFLVDPALLGGAKVQVGDHLVDASVRAQLSELQAQLAA